MPVCVVGMHRSGTSLVANLLSLCGVYLGRETDLMPPSSDNEKGYWENFKFVQINEEILQALGGSWDYPPAASDGWHEEDRIAPLKLKAENLLREFADYELWGWKDPRNSITLPFWVSLIPELKIVLCLRHPFEVSQSLRQRNYAANQNGLSLWWLYNQCVLDTSAPANRIVTHYESYFHTPRKELQRVLGFLNISASEDILKRCDDVISRNLRHSRFRTEKLLEESVAPEIFDLYLELCEEADFIQPLGITN